MSGGRIIIMAGGTGGHVYPGLAVAEALRARGVEVSWLGTHRGLEAQLVPKAGIAIDYIAISGLRGKGAVGWLLAPLRLTIALVQSLAVMWRHRPAAVLGMGGFVTGPGGVAAKLLGRPLLIHEQNAIAGMTNRWLSRIADAVLEAFPATFAPKAYVMPTGNPVRAAIAAVAEPQQRYAQRSGPLRLFVVGGSLGAQALNETVPQAVALLPQENRPLIRHQTGQKHFDAAQQAYDKAGVQGELLAYVDDMAAMYEWADLVICRAGALTVSELAAAGVPALLVPYPHAVDDHQTANGHYLTDAGAALLVQQGELDAQRLAGLINEFCTDATRGRPRLRAMAEAARALGRPAATAEVVAHCLAAARLKGEQR
ncbi:MAG TPA: undecaprenyldiphospho-muramoylpentapeptide beta-N-acetylglucosaminyltransferase [Gammaproteobacteria bacterium]